MYNRDDEENTWQNRPKVPAWEPPEWMSKLGPGEKLSLEQAKKLKADMDQLGIKPKHELKEVLRRAGVTVAASADLEIKGKTSSPNSAVASSEPEFDDFLDEPIREPTNDL